MASRYGSPLNVADRSADFHHHDISLALLGGPRDGILDGIGDVGNHLNGAAEEIATTFLCEHVGINLSRGDGTELAHRLVDEALVVAEIQIGLRSVISNEHFPVLERAHGSRIHVQVRIQLLHKHLEPAGFHDRANRCRGDSFAKTRANSSGDNDEFGSSTPWPS